MGLLRHVEHPRRSPRRTARGTTRRRSGLHGYGTDEPSSIGDRVSEGCIRVDNEVITEMASFLPLGTPVTITG